MVMNELPKTVMSIALIRVSCVFSATGVWSILQNYEVADDKEQAHESLAHPVVGRPPGAKPVSHFSC
jgi:hypothetical protein